MAAVAAAELLVGCATTATNYDYASEPDPRKHEFVLGPSDVLHVVVWHNGDLSVDATVRPDGTITLPLVGDLRAAGRTTTELRAEIAQRLGAFIKEAATVTVALALAGGPNRFGSADETVIMRTDKDGRPRRIPIDYPAILKGTRPDMNLVLMPGDVVYVP
jgi:polysaccharide export outer membrane protein